jgi:GNAT superfamily N-acetyltransferase
MDLYDESQYQELQRQRVMCGWDSDSQTLQKWKDKQELKKLFWITILDTNTQETAIRTGHISLDACSGLLEADIGKENEIELSISSFFILPEYRKLHLGKRAVNLLETLAVTKPFGDPRCRYITLTALSKRYVYDEAPEWRGMWQRLGMSIPLFSIQEWYESLGYVSWKVEPLYEEKALDGKVIVLWEAFMKKDLWAKMDGQVD